MQGQRERKSDSKHLTLETTMTIALACESLQTNIAFYARMVWIVPPTGKIMNSGKIERKHAEA